MRVLRQREEQLSRLSDIKSAEDRSRNMAAIKSKDTTPELYIRKLLFAEGFRFRTHSTLVPGHPDLWLRKYRTAIFVHGCFWHRHPGCHFAYQPKSRVDFWNTKFQKNIERDSRVKAELKEQNIRCLIIWECTIRSMRKDPGKEAAILHEIVVFLNGNALYQEL